MLTISDKKTEADTQSMFEKQADHFTNSQCERSMKMNLPLDPMMLLSVVNMNLRDRYPSLAEFCAAENVDQADLKKRLAAIDYYYEADSNQFR